MGLKIKYSKTIMGDNIRKGTFGSENDWTVVTKRRPVRNMDSPVQPYAYSYQGDDKISEPCWFYNNGGCRHKDGTEKTSEECKYLHIYSENVKRPPHLSTRKPCDKFNLEGECKWHDGCKYSHRNLTPEEWSRFYPEIPYTLKTNIQKRLQIESNIQDLEGKMRVMEFKHSGISKDVQQIGYNLQQCFHKIQIILDKLA
uniref:C3H1-type domain-containing protein n=1 Tax=Marseillevirus LCMAC201 TaxID=2506605 RepID=A0A481YXG9_9VIRU|nr:MAG: hypothetical protein LCMAC201_05140 [Marseillevirus LCMAC201]